MDFFLILPYCDKQAAAALAQTCHAARLAYWQQALAPYDVHNQDSFRAKCENICAHSPTKSHDFVPEVYNMARLLCLVLRYNPPTVNVGSSHGRQLSYLWFQFLRHNTHFNEPEFTEVKRFLHFCVEITPRCLHIFKWDTCGCCDWGEQRGNICSYIQSMLRAQEEKN